MRFYDEDADYVYAPIASQHRCVRCGDGFVLHNVSWHERETLLCDACWRKAEETQQRKIDQATKGAA